MKRNRLEAFSDGVLAIVITIMVLAMKVPDGSTLADLMTAFPEFLGYVLSFIYVAIYWNNHHHLIHAVTRVTPGVLWANMHLLFWLSLMPFTTAWLSSHPTAPLPVITYGSVLFFCGTAYYILQKAIVASEGPESDLAKSLGSDAKGKLSLVAYAIGIGCSTIAQGRISLLLYVAIALLWLIPDQRIERMLHEQPD